MSAPAWLGIAGWWLLALVFVVALCKAAGRADDAMLAEQRDRDQLAEVRHLCEYRRPRAHVRNGIGGKGTAA